MFKKQYTILAIVFLVALIPADSEAGCCQPAIGCQSVEANCAGAHWFALGSCNGNSCTVPCAVEGDCDDEDSSTLETCEGDICEFVDIPTISEWGLAVMTLLALSVGTLIFRGWKPKTIPT